MSNVIEIEHLYKEYRLGVIGYGTLREDLKSWWAGARGKEDPNSMLFSSGHLDEGRTSEHILALNDINLTVKKGERLGIIGANGAGKTTLLKILSRIASPTKGTAKIKGRVASLLAVGTGFHKELTGRENIYLNGAILGLRKNEIDERFDEIVNFSGVEQFIDTPVKRYSSGMHVRLGFAVAAHLDPDVLIVDEVLAVGDAEFQKKAIGKMKNVSKQEGRTVLFVSHNMTTIRKLCERTILLEEGEISEDDSSQKVIRSYLGFNSSSKKSYFFWKNSEVAPGNNCFRLESIGIFLENGTNSYSLDTSDIINITATYWCLRENSCFTPTLVIRNSDDIEIFECNLQTDLAIDEKERHNKLGHSLGKHQVLCQLPANFLTSNNYTIEFGSFETGNLVPKNMIFFEVIDSGVNPKPNIGKTGQQPWRGVIRFKPKWEMNPTSII